MPQPSRSDVGGEAESLGELSRLVFALKSDFHDDLQDIKDHLNRLEFVSPQVYAADRHTDQERHNGLAERVNRIESNVQWVWRTVGGAILATLVTAMLALSRVTHP